MKAPRTWDRRLGRLGMWVLAVTVIVKGFATPTPARASSRWEILEAIHAIENPHDVTRPGRHGELGAYQFRSGTWRMHTSQPFQFALDRAASDEIAVRHYEWIRRGLVRNGCEPSSYNIALAWNGGLTAVVNGRAPAGARDYAERVQNILQERKARTFASVP